MRSIHFIFQLMKEKALLEKRLATATEKILTEEERNRQNDKLRAKLEAKITDYEEENEKIKKVSKVISEIAGTSIFILS